MPDHSSRQDLPDDWSRGSHAARGAFSGAGTADGYGNGTDGAHTARATDAYRTIGFRAQDAGGYGVAKSDSFANADLFGEGGLFAPAAEAGTARAEAEPVTAAIGEPVPGDAADARGFLGALFDFGFTSFVTPKVIRVLYMLITIGTVVSALVFTIIVFKASTPFGILTLLFGDPLFILIVMAIYRMILEFFMVTHQAAEDLRALRERGDLR